MPHTHDADFFSFIAISNSTAMQFKGPEATVIFHFVFIRRALFRMR